MSKNTKPKFERDCEAAAEATGVRLSYCNPADDKSVDVVEDDGALIIRKGGVRAVFNIGQDDPLKEQNERISKVLTHLKLEKFIPKASYSAEDLRDEEDEDEKENGDYECPWCGNHHN